MIGIGFKIVNVTRQQVSEVVNVFEHNGKTIAVMAKPNGKGGFFYNMYYVYDKPDGGHDFYPVN